MKILPLARPHLSITEPSILPATKGEEEGRWGHCPKGSLCQEELKGANTCPANFPYFVLLRHKARERNEKVQAGETAQHGLAGEKLQWELRSKKLKGTKQMMSGERQGQSHTRPHISAAPVDKGYSLHGRYFWLGYHSKSHLLGAAVVLAAERKKKSKTTCIPYTTLWTGSTASFMTALKSPTGARA